MTSISAKQLKELLKDNSKDFQVIDVRTQLEWNEGHINDPRVINIEANSLLFNSNEVSKQKDVYVICESGGRSSFSQLILKTKGINSINVEGGMSDFRKLI